MSTLNTFFISVADDATEQQYDEGIITTSYFYY